MTEETNTTVSIIHSFNNTFEKGNLVDILSQVGEVGLDKVLEMTNASTILKDIPVLGLMVSSVKTITNIRSFMLANKVFKFFYGVKDIPIEKRQKFAVDYCRDNREDTAAALLNILDRLNNQNYVPIICRLMKAQIDGEITIPEFNRAVLALERTAYTDIHLLSKFINDYYEEGLAEAFESAGLVYQSVIDGGDADPNSDSGSKMRLSPTGWILLVYGLGQKVEAYATRSTDVKGVPQWNPVVEGGVLSFQKNR